MEQHAKNPGRPMMEDVQTLLTAEDPEPVARFREAAAGPVLLVCEHAGRRIPARLGDLGLSAEDRRRHIAWDVGAAGLARELARRLDACLLMQPYSRLVCDCNRRPHVDSFIVTVSEDTPVPGNMGLDPAQRRARIREVFEPFHRTVASTVERRLAQGRPTVFVTIHSFTPVFLGKRRPMHVGLLYNRHGELAARVGRRLRRIDGLVVADNEPYAMDDESDYTVPFHAERRGLPCLEIEVRHDLLLQAEGQRRMARVLAAALLPAVAELAGEMR